MNVREEKFEDTKGVIKNRKLNKTEKSKKNKQWSTKQDWRFQRHNQKLWIEEDGQHIGKK